MSVSASRLAGRPGFVESNLAFGTDPVRTIAPFRRGLVDWSHSAKTLGADFREHAFSVLVSTSKPAASDRIVRVRVTLCAQTVQ